MQNPGHTWHLALDTTMLWNRFCVVVVSVVVHGRVIPLLWQTLEHPSASVSASVSMALLGKADRLLVGFESITLLAVRAFPCEELVAWLRGRPRWSCVMRLHGDPEINGTAAPLGCQVRWLELAAGNAEASAECASRRWQPEREPGDRPAHRTARGSLVFDQKR